MSTLYKKVSKQILKKISSGEHKVGDRFPPEAIFAAELGISRSTLRMAFNELESSGVLRRRKRSGTQIIAAKPEPQFHVSATSFQETLDFVRNTPMRMERYSSVHTEEVQVLGDHASESDYWLEVIGSRTRIKDTLPICTNHIYIPARFAGIAHSLKEHSISVLQAMEEHYGVTVGRITRDVISVACDEKDAGILGLKTGAPILEIETVFYDQDGKMLKLTVSNFDTSRFHIHGDVSIV